MRRIVSVLLLSCVTVAFAQNTSHGRFEGKVQSEWSDDGRTMRLLQPFTYISPQNVRWVAPKGAVVDGASIPRFAWAIIGGPFEGQYRDASVIHDVACVEKKQPWQDVHRIFYEGMLARGVSLPTAKVMYAAVYHFGPRWERTVKRVAETASSVSNAKVVLAQAQRAGDRQPVFSTRTTVIEDKADGRERTVTEVNARFAPAPKQLSEADFQALAKQIEANENVSLESIEGYTGQ